MYDYKLLEAFAAVIQNGGFERAARLLHITQSAVSQRVKQLEEAFGRPLLMRKNPPVATEDGSHLLGHYLKVKVLEDELAANLNPHSQRRYPKLSIAINRDTLTLWFMDAMGDFIREHNLILEILAEDQEKTHEFLKDGRVYGCISSRQQSMQGCYVEPLGSMSYKLVATPAFAKEHFKKGVSYSTLREAPAVIFDYNDNMLDDYLKAHFTMAYHRPPQHVVPGVNEYARFITEGFGYGLLELSQIEQLLAEGNMVDLAPEKPMEIPLYWHTWQMGSELGKSFSVVLKQKAKEIFNQGSRKTT